METALELITKENRQLRKRLALSYGSFESEKEMIAFEEFEKKHFHDRNISHVNGGKVPYIIPYETIYGTLFTAVCQICGAKEYITGGGE